MHNSPTFRTRHHVCRHKSGFHYLLGCALVITINFLCATSIAQNVSNDSITITSLRDPDWKTYKAFLAGMHIFDQKRNLAPKANLRFALMAKVPDNDESSITIRIAGEQNWARVLVEPDQSFTLPTIPEAALDNADLLLNRKKGIYFWRPLILTPGLPAQVRRLGDLRLECEVRWAIEQDELPLIMKKVFNLSGGPCQSKQIKADFFSAKKISTITMIDGSRYQQLDTSRIVNESYRYYPLLNDTSWSDDTLLHFSFLEE